MEGFSKVPRFFSRDYTLSMTWPAARGRAQARSYKRRDAITGCIAVGTGLRRCDEVLRRSGAGRKPPPWFASHATTLHRLLRRYRIRDNLSHRAGFQRSLERRGARSDGDDDLAHCAGSRASALLQRAGCDIRMRRRGHRPAPVRRVWCGGVSFTCALGRGCPAGRGRGPAHGGSVLPARGGKRVPRPNPPPAPGIPHRSG
ncbi:MAG: hypothetical protein GAK28_01985 [Luteibacter sp.]|nr:MAG: hypothetical protein GAK28_01985 [Luteibacter sp.]